GQGGLSRNLFGCWVPLLDMADSKAGADQGVQRRAYSPVLLHHSLGKPIRYACALNRVTVDRPSLAAILPHQPSGGCWRHVDRVLDGEDEICAGNKRAEHC